MTGVPNTPISPCSHRLAFWVTALTGIPIYWCPVCNQHVQGHEVQRGL